MRTIALSVACLWFSLGIAAAQDRGAAIVPASDLRHVAPCAGPARCCEPPKVCVPQPDKKKTPKVTYSCKTEDYCLPRCSCALLGCMKDCDGPCLICERLRTRRILIKKIKEEECDILKCKPVVAPCQPACRIPAGPEFIVIPPETSKAK